MGTHQSQWDTRVRYAENKAAFVDIIGDPYALPEPIEGAYYRLKMRSQVGSQRITDLGHATANPARPNTMDFYADVERTVKEAVTNPTLLEKFWKTYLCDEEVLGQVERNRLEQIIGRKFRACKIFPAGQYFISVRRPVR